MYLAPAYRAQTACTLLTNTDLPIDDVAFAAGFASRREFEEAMQAIYGLTPSALRRDSYGSASTTATASVREAHGTSTPISFRLSARAPFDGRGLMAFFAAHAIAGVETADAHSFQRSVRLPGGIGHIEIHLDGEEAVLCTAQLDDIGDLSMLVSRVRRLLDLDADSAAIDGSLSVDPTFAPLIAERPGLRLPGILDEEETLFRTMIGQQISVASARTVLGRLSAELSETPGLFPTALEIAEKGAGSLRGPAPRVASILGAARAIADGSFRLDVGMPVAEFTAGLTALPGIGPWTAGYLAMRVLGDRDVLLSSDLVMLASASQLGLPSTARSLAIYGQRWAPWRSYAGLHLWAAAGR